MESLVGHLEYFLMNVFQEDFIKKEYAKLISYTPKSRPEELHYLTVPNIHRVAEWYRLLKIIKEREYSFDLNFSSDIEEFMKLLLFTISFNILLQQHVVSLNSKEIMGALKDRDRFESLMYEVIIASNYSSRGFNVKFPELYGGRTDIHAEKGGVEVHAECKKLRRNARYEDIAKKVGSWLHQEKLSILLDITLQKTPRSTDDVERVVELIKKAANDRKPLESGEVRVFLQKLPELVEGPFQIIIQNPEDVEFVLGISYAGIFTDGLQVKEPKMIILRNPNKYIEVSKQLRNVLENAHEQLKTAGSGYKVIYVDVSEVAGKPVLQLPEIIRLNTGPELLFGKLEEFVRSWLEEHKGVDGVLLTQPKLYMDPLGIPYAISVENKTITSYTAPGWTVMMEAVPFPKNAQPEILVNLGVDFANRGIYRLAELYYRKAIELKPDLKEAYNNLGKLLINLGRIQEAMKYLDKALEIDHNYVPAIINKGIALTNTGRYEEALEYFNKAVALNPREEKAWYNKALIHYFLGRIDEANKCLLKALEINPNYEEALILKKHIEHLNEEYANK
ncbi:MAG: tetratricopeptide repeat protein [Thermosphaera sp.]